MKSTVFALVLLCAPLQAQEVCHLDTYASSWMKTGTPFSVTCPSGKYAGTLIAHEGKRWFRRGSLQLKFDARVSMAPTKRNPEGKIKASRGRQIADLMLAGGSGIGAKDCLDGLSGAIFKSWYMIPVTFTAAAFLEKGGEVNLKPGYELNLVVEPASGEQSSGQPASGQQGAGQSAPGQPGSGEPGSVSMAEQGSAQ